MEDFEDSDYPFFILYSNVLKMLEKRGFEVRYFNTLNEFKDNHNLEYLKRSKQYTKIQKKLIKNSYTTLRELSSFILKKNNNGVKEKVFVFFASLFGGKQISINTVEFFLREFTESEPNITGIFIHNEPLSASAKSRLIVIPSVQIFQDLELMYNPTLSNWGSQIEKLSDEEVENILKESHLSLSSFPVISKDDPISKYYNLKLNDVIRIKRDILIDTVNVNSEISYRIVRNKNIDRSKTKKKVKTQEDL